MSTFSFDLFEKFLSPFSGHMLEYKGVLYTTVEHAYHCARYTDPAVIAEIMAARSAYLAWEVSQKYKQTQLADFDARKVGIMEELFRAKLAQHRDVEKVLRESGESELVKHQEDRFWGDGLDGQGQNEMGKVWMKIRADIQ